MIEKIVMRPYRGTDKWEADVFMLIDGETARRRWCSPLPSKQASERWAREKGKAFIAKHSKRPAIQEEEENPPPVKSEAPLLKDFAVRWMDEYVIANRHSPATVEGRRKCLKNHLLPLLGDLRLDAIGPAEYQKLRKERRHLATETVNLICDQLTTMLHVAVDWKVIVAAPRVKRLKVEEKEMDVLTPEQGEHLVETTLKFGAKFHLVALLGVDCGLRNSEIMGLRWSDIDFDEDEIVVRNRIWCGQDGPPKHGKIRHVPLTRRLREALLAFPRSAKYVFVTFKGTPIKTSLTLMQWLEPIWAKAQVPRGIHTLRHTFATDVLDAGVSVRTLQDLLGHGSLTTTERYIHKRKKNLRKAAQALEQSREQRDWRNPGEDHADP